MANTMIDEGAVHEYHTVVVAPNKTGTGLKVADEVWVAAALLHREHPEQEDFTVKEVEARAAAEHPDEPARPGVYVHALQHCVGNLPPNSGRYRMLYATAKGRRRLFRPHDSFHPLRARGKMTPAPEELPARYRGLLEWYRVWAGQGQPTDALLALAGSGRALWAEEHADAYVRRLREGWE